MACADEAIARSPFAVWEWRRIKALTFFDRVLRVRRLGLGVKTHDPNHLRVENLANLVPDQIVNRLHIELRGKTLLHAVNDLQFGFALLEITLQRCSRRLIERHRRSIHHALGNARATRYHTRMFCV